MKPLMLEEVRRAIHGRWLARGEALTVRSVTTDTRSARAGELFFALRGERMDGHRFLPQAAEAGCVGAVVAMDAELPDGMKTAFDGGIIGVADTIAALGELGAYYRRQLGASVVAVTGSNGKTTVKRMIHHILARRLTGTCSPKSFNNAIGVPLTLLAVSAGDDYVVCELGTNAPGEISLLAGMARPDVAVITSVSPAHLEKLKSVERVAAEKASILGALAEDGLAVVCGDSELLARALRVYDRRIIRFGVSREAELRLTGHEPLGRRQRFELNGCLWVDLPLAGRHNALNALAAIAVARRFGFERQEAAAALADFPGGDMRTEWIDLPGGTVINDAYNANPASLAAAVDVLADCPGARKVLVAGDMKELGEKTEEFHRQAGLAMAGRGVDLLITVGPLGRYIAMGAAEGGLQTEAFDSGDAAGRQLRRLLRQGDTVLVKGSRAMAMEALIDPIRTALSRATADEPPDGPEGQGN
ncbi:MAG: UDP-N-acetylmuramoyl-tripeptide--D-alanyl-D-alanine ligase [Phycisphaerae bacterium]